MGSETGLLAKYHRTAPDRLRREAEARPSRENNAESEADEAEGHEQAVLRRAFLHALKKGEDSGLELFLSSNHTNVNYAFGKLKETPYI